MKIRWLIAIGTLLCGCHYHGYSGDFCDDDRDHEIDEWDWRGDDDAGPDADSFADAGMEPGPGTTCVDLADCAEGQVCVEGACTDLDDACRFDHDCGRDRACVDNACRPRCADDSECTAGTACTDGLCLPADQCTTSAECAASEVCVDARCLAACAADTECGTDETCAADMVCRPDARPRPFCSIDEDCAAGHLCVFGVCRTPCPTTTDEECQRWDSQLIRCDESEAGLFLCFSRHESNPECTTPADCAEGQSCRDAICH